MTQKPVSSLPVNFLIWLVTYIINEIKETDVYSGGHTNISIIDQRGWKNISKETILKHYEDGIQRTCKGLSQLFKDSSSAERFLRDMFPR
jgi:hypothetical protein